MLNSAEMAALRARLRTIDTRSRHAGRTVSFDCARVNAVLGPVLRYGRMHEISGPAATFFAALLLARCDGPVLWCMKQGAASRLYPPGLMQAGLDPARLVLVQLGNADDLLHAAHEGLRTGWHVALEISRAMDLKASRRLMLAAETGEGMGLAIGLSPTDQGLLPSAVSRWQAAFGDGGRWPESCHLSLQLLRNRGGVPGQWIMEWNHASRIVSLVSPAFDRQDREAQPLFA